jgi:hypothetical protein
VFNRLESGTMKPLHITESKRDRIKQELDAANGSATEHVFFTSQVFKLAEKAETEILRYVLKKEATGARFQAVSGMPVAKAYSYVRVATEVVLERRSTGWFMVEVRSRKIWPNQGGETELQLTREQDIVAVSNFRARYSVLPEPNIPSAPTRQGELVHEAVA